MTDFKDTMMAALNAIISTFQSEIFRRMKKNLEEEEDGNVILEEEEDGSKYLTPKELDYLICLLEEEEDGNVILEGVPGAGRILMGIAAAEILDVPVCIGATSPINH